MSWPSAKPISIAPIASASDRSSAIGQTMLSLLVAAAIAFAAGIPPVLMHFDQIVLPYRMAKWQAGNWSYMDNRLSDNPADRLIYGVMERDDYSKGGVYFIGSSVAQRGLKVWDFTPDEQKLVKNYCLEAMIHSEENQFVHLLVEHRGLLKAGGERNSVVLELYFGDGGHHPPQGLADNLWTEAFTRFGIYRYDLESGISPMPMPAWKRKVKMVECRAHSFWTIMDNFAMLGDAGYISPRATHTPEASRKYWQEALEADWEKGMDIEVGKLAETIDYLQARHVNVTAFYFPLASWFDNFPQEQRYRQMVLALAKAKSVPVADLSHILKDEDFADSVHLSFTGSEKLEPYMMEIAREQLRLINAESGK